MPVPARRAGAGWGGLAAAAVLLLVCGWGWWSARREADLVRGERDRLARQVTGLDQQLAASRAANVRLSQALQILSAPGLRPIALAGLQGAPGAKGHAFIDPESSRALFFAANLPALPPDKTYELWSIVDGKPVPAGTFGVDESGRGSVQVDRVAPVDRIEAWAVTIEPRGGVPQPTGAMVLKG